MTWEIILTVVFAILTIAGILVSYYFYVKNKITKAIADEVDNAGIDDVEGPAKKAEVIAQLQKLIPAVLKPFITYKMLDALVQTVFDGIERYAKKQVKKKAEKTDEDS